VRPARRVVSVIVPTLGLPERSDLLEAAVASITDQADVEARPIVVLNGSAFSVDVEERLRGDPRVGLVVLEDADLPAALRAGREAVRAPYFATLDDDDALLPGALARHVEALEEDAELDVVVANGIVRSGATEVLHVAPDDAVTDDPMRALLRKNWLLPGSWLGRTERLGVELLRAMPRYLECTYLALRFSGEYRMRWLPEPGVLHRVDGPLSVSRSRAYALGQAEALRGLLALDLPHDVARAFERRIAEAHHAASERDRLAGRLWDAWRWHLASLVAPGGWRYLPYTRRLLPFAPNAGS